MSTEDTTTPDQRAYWHVMHDMLAEAKRPTDRAEMNVALTALRKQVNREAKSQKVPFDEWHDEVARRLKRLMHALCLPLPRLAGSIDIVEDDE